MRKYKRKSLPSHCKRGHEYTEANTRFDREGARECRACAREKVMARRIAARGYVSRERPTQADLLLRRVVNSSDGCWLWQGHVNPVNGYSYAYSQERGRNVLGHRLAYETFVGPIPAGLTIDHLCRVKTCINPAHLEPVTQGENLRRIPLTPSCKRGHPFSSIKVQPNGKRKQVCRTCSRAAEQRYRERKRAAA